MNFTKEEISILIQSVDIMINQVEKANKVVSDKIDLIPLLSLKGKLNKTLFPQLV